MEPKEESLIWTKAPLNDPPPPTQEERQSYMEAFGMGESLIWMKAPLNEIPEKTLQELGFTSVTDMINILVTMKVAGWIGTSNKEASNYMSPTPKNLEELTQMVYEEGGVDTMRKMAEAWLEIRHGMTLDDVGKKEVQ
jgi:hypothetical protein